MGIIIKILRSIKMVGMKVFSKKSASALVVADLSREVKLPNDLPPGGVLCMDIFKEERVAIRREEIKRKKRI